MTLQGRLRAVFQAALVLSLTVMIGTAVALETPESKPDSQVTETRSPVVVGGRTLFYVQDRVYSLSPEERARLISGRISKLHRDSEVPLAELRVEEGENTSDIVAGDRILMSVTDNDARTAGVTRQKLARDHAETIRKTTEEIRRRTGLRSILLGVVWMVIATGILLLALRGLSLLFPKIYARLESWRGTRIPSLRIQKLELLPADRITDLLLTLAKWTRIACVVLLFYVYLPLVLSFFPWTQGYASVIFTYILKPLRIIGAGILDYLPNLFFIAAILFASYYLMRVVKFFFAELGKGTINLPGFYPDWTEPTFKIVKFLIIAFTVVVAFPYLPGSKSPAFQGVSIFLGLLFSLGSTSAVANVVAGLVLTYTRAFQLGDRVKIGDTIGDVVEKTLLVTRIRTVKNVDIAIPNSMVLNSHIVNYSSSGEDHGLILHTSVTIGYDAPWRKVHELLLAAATATSHILPEPKPFVLQTGLSDFYVEYELNAYTDQPNVMSRTYSELHQNIQDAFNEAGVEIMSPHYGALRDGNFTTIPESHRPKDYVAPAFRVAVPPWRGASQEGASERG